MKTSFDSQWKEFCGVVYRDFVKAGLIKPMETIEVTWRSLKKDPPTKAGTFWVYKESKGPVLWKCQPDLDFGKIVQMITGCGFTHWATAVLPKPPENPTPFELWVNKLHEDGKDVYDGNVRLRMGPSGTSVFVSEKLARTIFEAGYNEACQPDTKKGTP